jgi:hypothetical protein
MCSDVNHRMYQLGNNTQQIKFKHILNGPNDKLFKSVASDGVVPSPNDLTYLKILVKGKNHTVNTIAMGDLNITMRVKVFNQYKDMKVLSGNAIALN